jgi:hypothetical protein
MHVSCTDTNTVSKQTETRFLMTRSPRNTINCVQNEFRAFWYVWQKTCTNLVSKLALSKNDRKEHPLEPCHLGVPPGASKKISVPMVHLAQTMHLSCNDTNTVSKRTETRFQITHVIRCAQNDFRAFWYVRRKTCTYLASTLALSPNGPKRAST